MPPRAVWKTRPSGVVPYLRIWARSRRTRSGGIGDGAGLSGGAVLEAAFLPGGAVVGPRGAGAGRGGGQGVS
jgi:hypothetical protein